MKKISWKWDALFKSSLVGAFVRNRDGKASTRTESTSKMGEGEAMEEQGRKDGKEGGGGKGSIWPPREPASERKKASGMPDRQACVGDPVRIKESSI